MPSSRAFCLHCSIMKQTCLVLALLLQLTLFCGWAESIPAVPEDIPTLLGQMARTRLHEARLPDGSLVPAETPQERAQPLLPPEAINQVVNHGMYAEMLETCGLAWQENFAAFMAHERGKDIWSPKQMAYIALLHGLSMGFFREALQENGGCTPEIRHFVLPNQYKAATFNGYYQG